MIDTNSPVQNHAQLPHGVADYFWDEALQRRRLEADLLEMFRCWGYADVIPPTFEYADTLNARTGGKLRSAMYRLMDRDGSTLSLRVDMTIPVARLVGTRLHDWPMPQRFCYAGSVFRYAEPQAGRQREFWQAGVELIGAASPAADAEVLALTAHALQTAGISAFRLVVGQMHYFDGLLSDLQLGPDEQNLLLAAIDRNSAAELADFLRDVPLRTQQRRTVEELPGLSGDNPERIIAQADRLCLNYAMHAAVENLRQICSALDAYGVLDRVFLDLTEIHDLGYYSGITFEALTPELGFSIGSGGRYDNLIGTFGAACPAVGVALGLDRILLARRLQDSESSSAKPVAAQILVAAGDDRTCLQLVADWRALGIRVAVDVNDSRVSSLLRLAADSGIPSVLVWTGAAFEIYDSPDQPEAPMRFATAADCRREIIAKFSAHDRTGAG